jgi:two-component system response regulator PilR (NtrC family)
MFTANKIKPSILVVDDNRDSRELLSLLFEKANYEIVPCKSYSDAIKRIRNNSFDLYLLDVKLPDGDGISLCREIRRKSSDKPILFWTGDVTRQTKEKALKAGATQFLTKPCDIFEILETVRNYC